MRVKGAIYFALGLVYELIYTGHVSAVSKELAPFAGITNSLTTFVSFYVLSGIVKDRLTTKDIVWLSIGAGIGCYASIHIMRWYA